MPDKDGSRLYHKRRHDDGMLQQKLNGRKRMKRMEGKARLGEVVKGGGEGKSEMKVKTIWRGIYD